MEFAWPLIDAFTTSLTSCEVKYFRKSSCLLNKCNLGLLECPYSTGATAADVRVLSRTLEKDVKFLFGSATPGATKLDILNKAFDEDGEGLSKQKTFLLARELFPAKKECHAKEGLNSI
jgi:hypothetical protein